MKDLDFLKRPEPAATGDVGSASKPGSDPGGRGARPDRTGRGSSSGRNGPVQDDPPLPRRGSN